MKRLEMDERSEEARCNNIPPPDAFVVGTGPRPAQLYLMYRRIFQVTPEQAKALLAAPRVKVACGNDLDWGDKRLILELQSIGATLEFAYE